MAEYYHVLDYKALPVKLLAALCFGLRESSRVMSGISGLHYSIDTILNAVMADELATLIWQRTKDGANGTNQPERITPMLLKGQTDSDIQGFDTPDEFERKRKELMGL